MLKCRFYCYFYGIFMRALMCIASTPDWHTIRCSTPRYARFTQPSQVKPSQAIQHAFRVGLWSHKINCDYRRAFNSVSLWLCALHSVAADTHTFGRFRAWSRRLSHKNDKKIRDQFTGAGANFLPHCVCADPATTLSQWVDERNCTLWMERCDGTTRTRKQIVALLFSHQCS